MNRLSILCYRETHSKKESSESSPFKLLRLRIGARRSSTFKARGKRPSFKERSQWVVLWSGASTVTRLIIRGTVFRLSSLEWSSSYNSLLRNLSLSYVIWPESLSFLLFFPLPLFNKVEQGSSLEFQLLLTLLEEPLLSVFGSSAFQPSLLRWSS